jgi:hypothetical protein
VCLYDKQSAMRLRQKHLGRPPRVRVTDPVSEMRARIRYAQLWVKGETEESIAKKWDRPREWVRDWLSDGCPLFLK